MMLSDKNIYGKILLIDDSEIFIYIFKRFVSRNFSNVIVDDLIPGSINEVIKFLKDNPYNTIFIDLQFGTFSGLELMTKIKEKYTYQCYALTNHDVFHFKKRCIDAGFVNVISKGLINL